MAPQNVSRRSQFGDPGYTIPEVEYLQNQQQEDEDLLGETPVLPEKAISDELRKSLMNGPDPVTENAKIALQGIQSGPSSVPIPDELKPRTTKQMLKEALLGMIPVYGSVRAIQQAENRNYNLEQYKQEIIRQKQIYDTKKDAAMKWHDAAIKQNEEQATRQSKVRFLLSVYGNVPPSYIMKAAGISIPTSKQVKMEPVMVRKYLKDGKTVGEPEMAIYNPALGVFTVQDPDSGEDVTIPKNLIASAEKMGAAGQDPYGVRAEGLQQRLGRPLQESELLNIYGADNGASGGSAEERMAWTAAEQKFTGKETPQEKQAIYLNEYKKLKMMVPQFTSGAADQRSEASRISRMKTRFAESQPSKRFTNAADATNFALSILPKSQNSADHIAMIYKFAKGMDLESVVREGEYKTIQDYAQALIDKAGLSIRRIFDNKGFLTPEAISNMQKTLLNQYNSTKAIYENYRSEVGKMIDDETGETGGVNLLPNMDAFPNLGKSSGGRIPVTGADGKGRYTLPPDQVERYLKKNPKARRLESGPK